MAEPKNLLLFDTNPRHLDTLRFGFEKAGCSVVATSDVETARGLLQTSQPSVVVVGVHASDPRGFDLVRSLGHADEATRAACVAFGRPELRSDSVAAGALGFLQLPIFVSDIIGVCRLIAATSGSQGRLSAEEEVVMNADEIEGIYHLVRVLSVIGRSAVVAAVHGGKRAELRFIDGVLTAVELGSVQGLPALHHLLLWDGAKLKLKFKSVVRRGSQLSLKPAEVLEECDRFLRDFAHEVAALGHGRTVYAPNAARRPAPNMPREVVPVLKKFDGHRSLAEVIEESPFRVFDTLRIIKRFVADEAIVRVSPAGAHPSVTLSHLPGPAALDTWFQRSAGSTVIAAGVISGVEPVGADESGVPAAEAASLPDRKASLPSPPAENRGTTLRLVPSANVAPANVAPAASRDRDSAHPSSRGSAAPAASLASPTAASSEGEFLRAPTNVTHGEIRVPQPGARTTASIPSAGSPSVFVNLAPPAAMAASTVAVALASPAVAAYRLPPEAAPAAPTRMATVELAVAAPLDEVPPAATALAPSQGHGGEVPSPAAPARTQAKHFDEVESDFFAREADLYRRDSVESFDDLEGVKVLAPPLSNPQGKR